jgi:hypothetical protein
MASSSSSSSSFSNKNPTRWFSFYPDVNLIIPDDQVENLKKISFSEFEKVFYQRWLWFLHRFIPKFQDEREINRSMYPFRLIVFPVHHSDHQLFHLFYPFALVFWNPFEDDPSEGFTSAQYDQLQVIKTEFIKRFPTNRKANIIYHVEQSHLQEFAVRVNVLQTIMRTAITYLNGTHRFKLLCGYHHSKLNTVHPRHDGELVVEYDTDLFFQMFFPGTKGIDHFVLHPILQRQLQALFVAARKAIYNIDSDSEQTWKRIREVINVDTIQVPSLYTPRFDLATFVNRYTDLHIENDLISIFLKPEIDKTRYLFKVAEFKRHQKRQQQEEQ